MMGVPATILPIIGMVFPTGPPGIRHDLFLPAEAIRYPFFPYPT